MKTLFVSPLRLACLVVLLSIACKKPTPGDENANWDLYRSRITIMGYDKILLWPENKCSFDVQLIPGTLQFTPASPLQIKWRVISGPGTPIIDTGRGYADYITRFSLSGLTIGTYEFEVSFDETNGKFNRDTCRIFVDRLSNPPGEYIFYDQHWVTDTFPYSLPTDMSIKIANIYRYIPIEKPFKVFVKNSLPNATWEEVKPGSRFWYLFEYRRSSDNTNKGVLTVSIAIRDNNAAKADIKLQY